MTVLLTIAGAIFALSALLAVIRVVLGPTVLDRMIAADVLLTIVLLVVGAEMVVSGHTRNLVVMLVIVVIVAIPVRWTCSETIMRRASPTPCSFRVLQI